MTTADETPAAPDVREQMRVKQTDLGEVVRLDVNQLGARLPPDMDTGDVPQDWSSAQSKAICQTLAGVASEYGGDFCSFGEWTVIHGAGYDLADIRVKRLDRFGEGYRAAITTLPWIDPESRWSARVQATAYIPRGTDADFEQVAVRPESIYDTEFLGLAPAVISRFGGARVVYLSGVVAWTDEIELLFMDDPRAQIRRVFEMIGTVFEELGGSREDVVRLRPFMLNPEVARIVREEAERFWAGCVPPTMLIADGVDFWGEEGLFTEIQVMGMLGDGDLDVSHEQLPRPAAGSDDALVVRRTRSERRELIQAGEIRGRVGTSPEQEARQAAEAVGALMAEEALKPEDVCSLIVYAGSRAAAEGFEASIRKILPPETLHLVHGLPMGEMDGRQLKVEFTAERLRGKAG